MYDDLYHSVFCCCFLSHFQRRTLEHGTTTACYFATIHLEASKELCKVVGK